MITGLQKHVLDNYEGVTLEAKHLSIGAWLFGREMTGTVTRLLKRQLLTGDGPGRVKITLAGKRELAEARP